MFRTEDSLRKIIIFNTLSLKKIHSCFYLLKKIPTNQLNNNLFFMVMMRTRNNRLKMQALNTQKFRLDPWGGKKKKARSCRVPSTKDFYGHISYTSARNNISRAELWDKLSIRLSSQLLSPTISHNCHNFYTQLGK